MLAYTITSADTAVHTVLTGTGIGSIPGDVAAGGTSTFSQSLGIGDYFLQVTANGALGATGSYTVSATFPTVTLGRGRAARH